MSDLVKRLRAWHTPNETITGDVQLYLEAAAHIEALEAALRKIAELEYLTDEAMQKIAADALDLPGRYE